MVHLRLENSLKDQGFGPVAGVDEAGRGPLAGPVFAAAVILPKNFKVRLIDDSKKLTSKQRDTAYELILKYAVSIGLGIVNENTIDKINILQATFKAMKNALEDLEIDPEYILVDGNRQIPFISLPQKTIIGGDGISASVAAASIIAKVSRDRYMIDLHNRYPKYGFNRHKGYGTKAHLEALNKYGPCPVHRMTFGPVLACNKKSGVLK
jgi:ribonuclease HII